MAVFSQEFKVQSVEKALSRNPEQSLKEIAINLGIGYSTLQKWIRLAKENQLERPESSMSKEKSPHDWNKAERFEAIVHCHPLTDEEASAYCREKGIYLHGMPYMFAPESQTHVPMIVWIGPSSDIEYQTTIRLKDEQNSHDAITTALLDAFEIETDTPLRNTGTALLERKPDH